MSLSPSVIGPVPEQTARIARAAFPKGNLYLKLRDELGTLFDDRDFVELFSKRWHPWHAPWRLALITIMQFLENLSDRQAAEAVRSRIDWKYVLGLELSDSGFDYSVLSGFRERLVSHRKQELLLDRMLELLREKQLITERGKQRTDPGACARCHSVDEPARAGDGDATRCLERSVGSGADLALEHRPDRMVCALRSTH
jgi:transposase